jgi:hypothetical protein
MKHRFSFLFRREPKVQLRLRGFLPFFALCAFAVKILLKNQHPRTGKSSQSPSSCPFVPFVVFSSSSSPFSP